MRSWKASLNRFRPTWTTRCIRTDRWSSIIRLRTYIGSGTQPDSRSTYMTAWLKTIRTDLREEIGFLKVFDAAIRATMDIVDMPDRRASLLVRLILQNNGRLSQTKRATFSELKDEEISAIEEAVASLSQEGPSS